MVVLVNRQLTAVEALQALRLALETALTGLVTGVSAGPGWIAVYLGAGATAEDENTARQVVLAHDMDERTEEQVELAAIQTQTSGVISQYLASPLSDRTPQQVYDQVASDIAGWGTLADAKADLQQWLPFLCAVTQLVIRRIKIGDL